MAVEAALAIAALMFLILGSLQFGLVFWTWNTMLLAVEEAGRYAMLYNPVNYPKGPPAANCSAATVTLANCAVAWANQNWSNLFTVSCTAGCTGAPTTMTFTATYTFNFINTFSLSRAVEVPLI